MSDYRLYWMNELGHIERVGEFDAEDDATAIATVEQSRGHSPLELWCGTRKVKCWDVSPVSSPNVST